MNNRLSLIFNKTNFNQKFYKKHFNQIKKMKKIISIIILFFALFSTNAQTVDITINPFGGGYTATIILGSSIALNTWELELEQTAGSIGNVNFVQVAGAAYTGAPSLVVIGNKVIVNSTDPVYGPISAGGTATVILQVMSSESSPTIQWNYFPSSENTNGGGSQPKLISQNELWENGGINNYAQTTPDLYSLKIGGYTAIGTDPSSNIQLLVKGDKGVGFCVEQDANLADTYGIKSKVANSWSKALAVEDVSNNNAESFLVYGNGKTRIGGGINLDMKFSVRDLQANILACSDDNVRSVFWAKNPTYAYGFGIGDDHNGHIFQDIHSSSSVMTFDNENVIVDNGFLHVGGNWQGSILAKLAIKSDEVNVVACSALEDRPSTFWAKNPDYAYGFGIGSDNKGHIFQNINSTSSIMTFDNNDVTIDQGNFKVNGDLILEKSIGGPSLTIQTHGANTAAISMHSGQGYSDIYHYDENNQFVSNIRFQKNGGFEFTTRYENGVAVNKNRFAVLGNGDMYFYNAAGIGAAPDPDVQLRVTGNKKVGLCIQHQYGSTDGYGLKTYVNSITTKAFAVVDVATDKDVYRVMGDGAVYATEVNVRVPLQFPDYVFSSEYELMPLKELASYIEKNKKLPKLPAATDVKENGINIASLNVQLVEKIEELTLHAIGQETTLEKQASLLEKQQKLILNLSTRLDQLENK